jgi:hypothetical protein
MLQIITLLITVWLISTNDDIVFDLFENIEVGQKLRSIKISEHFKKYYKHLEIEYHSHMLNDVDMVYKEGGLIFPPMEIHLMTMKK